MKSILFCSVGRRGTLIKNAIKTLHPEYRIIATDCSLTAPAIYLADKYYIVPSINDSNYIDILLKICKENNVLAITTLIDPEIELLARNKEIFEKENIIVLTPDIASAKICFDKYEMYMYLKEKGLNTVMTFDNIVSFENAYKENKITFPVFIKPRTGSGSVGAEKISDLETLKDRFRENCFDFIIQEYMSGLDFDTDVYIDIISHNVVSAFAKKKIETRIGGASKTVSFKDQKLFDFIKQITKQFHFCGTVDMDFFYQNGIYYLSEINPRFGGAYLHAYGAGVDFFQFLKNNLEGKINKEAFGIYEDNIVMLMYDEVVIQKLKEGL